MCYAEKTSEEGGAGDNDEHRFSLIPHLSTVRSPQQMGGILARQLAAASRVVTIYHVTVMPCFDKKLEACRPNFALDGSPEVDLVLATNELMQLLEDASSRDANADGHVDSSGLPVQLSSESDSIVQRYDQS